MVAVTNFDQPFSFMACTRVVLLGYYVDEERYIATGGREGRLKGEAPLRVFKDNDSQAELGMFTTPAYREISAVIFSSCTTIGKVRAMSSDPTDAVFTALRLNPNSDRPQSLRSPKRRYEENLLEGFKFITIHSRYKPSIRASFDTEAFSGGTVMRPESAQNNMKVNFYPAKS